MGLIYPHLPTGALLSGGLNGGAHVLFYTSATITINLVRI